MPAKKKAARKVVDVGVARPIRARYDNAKMTDENANLWKDVDSLSAAMANNPSVRKILRERARYEISNNPYAKGIVHAVANETVGPEVQIQLGDSTIAEQAEKDFSAWAEAVGFWAKVRTMRKAKISDGEVFAMMVTNPRTDHDIKLDLRIIECDQIESWATNVNREDEIDGIRFDDYGNPVEYRLLTHHPGDYRSLPYKGAGEWIKRKHMIHYFTADRPGQVRGVTELAPALNLFGQLRKYTVSVLECASRAAEITLVMETNLVPDQVAAELADPVTVMDIQRNQIMSIPEGWGAKGFKAEQPTNTYKDFKYEIVNEIARTLNIPYAIAAGNSAGYNYASGRLDIQAFDRAVDIERADLRMEVLDRVYAAWLREYAARKSLTKEVAQSLRDHRWLFIKRGHVDPNKEANAVDTRLGNLSLTYAELYADEGKDWKREYRQAITERIDMEREWISARKAAKLPPAPFPWGNTKPGNSEPKTIEVTQETQDSEGEAKENEGQPGEQPDNAEGLAKWLT
jgi:lambda family phage portal protein